jgi:undecaprenyl-diphosphatase
VLPILILALVQGLTEFLPVSSSGHLVITWSAFDALDWTVAAEGAEERLILDIAVHVGTLGAVLVYFRAEVAAMGRGLLRLPAGHRDDGARLLIALFIGSLPLVATGVLLKDLVTAVLRDPAIAIQVVAWATIGFGVLLHFADRGGAQVKEMGEMTAAGALAIGCAQVLALIPGTSRSGITMTAARALGFRREAAARFSMLLAIPAILGAGVLAGFDLLQAGNARLGFDALVAAALAFVFALLAIAVLLRWLRHAGFLPFVVYRLALGAILLLWFA